jgi:hypothetical protein
MAHGEGGGVWMRLYEDKIRSVEGPDAIGGGPGVTSPALATFA